MGQPNTPTRGLDFIQRIREYRIAQGIMVKEAAARMGVRRDAWSHLEGGRRNERPLFDSVAAMAEAVGLRVELVEPEPMKRVPPVGTGKGSAGRSTAQIIERIKAERERRGLTLRGAARRAGLTPGALHDMEGLRGEPRMFRVGKYASAVGMRVDLVDEAHASLMDLDEDEVEALRNLVQWYVRQTGKKSPLVFRTIAEKLHVRQQEETAA